MKYNIKEDFDNLEKAGVDITGLKINVSFSQNAYAFFIDEDDTRKYVDIEITIDNEFEDCVGMYGKAYGRLITTFDHVTGKELNYLDVIDSIDQDTYNCLSVFIDRNSGDFDDDLMFSQFFYLDRIVIEKEHRGKGLGAILLEYIKYKFADIITAIVLLPLAFEQVEESTESFKLESERLCCFYERHGFKNFRDETWIFHEC